MIYTFKSEAASSLFAFAGDGEGTRLPPTHGPWVSTGTITARQALPHRLDREVVEAAIEKDGYQLWRMKPRAASEAPQPTGARARGKLPLTKPWA